MNCHFKKKAYQYLWAISELDMDITLISHLYHTCKKPDQIVEKICFCQKTFCLEILLRKKEVGTYRFVYAPLTTETFINQICFVLNQGSQQHSTELISEISWKRVIKIDKKQNGNWSWSLWVCRFWAVHI